MERTAMAKLEAWKQSQHRKPLIVQGARQVGKTWCLRELGQRSYDTMAYVNFEANPSLAALFAGDINTDRIIAGLGAVTGTTIQPGQTLIVLDEIQEVPRALTSLKYFAENASDYHVAAAGSLLGVALHRDSSFPVGKVDFLNVGPLTFTEFLQANNQGALVTPLIHGDWPVVTALHETYTAWLRDYLCVGGMPEAVVRFTESRDYAAARSIQQAILEAYARDFSKHAPTIDVPRIGAVWRSLPSQLAKSSGRFVYGNIAPGARGRQYESAIMWLQQAGLVQAVRLLTTPRLPLSAYEDDIAFKLYAVDIGLLMALSGLDVSAVIEGDRLFTEFKGALTEQYVAQELLNLTNQSPHYWTSGPGGAEVDFVVQIVNDIIPVEVKAERNLRAKSLQVYRDRYQPPLAIRSSLAPYAEKPGLIDLPLYAIAQLEAVTRFHSQPNSFHSTTCVSTAISGSPLR